MKRTMANEKSKKGTKVVKKVMTAAIVKKEATASKSDFDLMIVYGFNDINTFHGELEKLFHGKELINIKSQLEKNRKKVERPCKKEKVCVVEILEAKEKRLSNEVVDLTNKIKDLRSKKAHNRQEISEIAAEFEEVKKMVEAIGEKMKSKEEIDRKLTDAINELNPLHYEKQTELENIRKEIEAQKSISVYVTKDGSIQSTAKIDDTGWTDLKNELSEREEYSQLTNAQTKTLAKIKAIRDNNPSKEVIFKFEDYALKKAYNLL